MKLGFYDNTGSLVFKGDTPIIPEIGHCVELRSNADYHKYIVMGVQHRYSSTGIIGENNFQGVAVIVELASEVQRREIENAQNNALLMQSMMGVQQETQN